jgi:hypothetical protein
MTDRGFRPQPSGCANCDAWRRQYIDLAAGVRNIREALETAFGASILPGTEQVETSLQECELIARAIYSLTQP